MGNYLGLSNCERNGEVNIDRGFTLYRLSFAGDATLYCIHVHLFDYLITMPVSKHDH